jgi:type IV secretory pathway protease TraF
MSKSALHVCSVIISDVHLGTPRAKVNTSRSNPIGLVHSGVPTLREPISREVRV